VDVKGKMAEPDSPICFLNKGDSATGIGIGTGDYEGWSLIQTQDWKIVYVSSEYLSATKPSTNNGDNTQGKPQGSYTAGQPTGGGQSSGDSSTAVDNGTDQSLISNGDRKYQITQEELAEGIDPNQNPWDDNTEISYGGN
jgi:hypothetical protein